MSVLNKWLICKKYSCGDGYLGLATVCLFAGSRQDNCRLGDFLTRLYGTLHMTGIWEVQNVDKIVELCKSLTVTVYATCNLPVGDSAPQGSGNHFR